MTEELGWNPRYANYARVNGRTPDEQLAYDKGRHPSACMMEFVFWNTDRLHEAMKEVPEAFFCGHLVGHEIYDEWLTKRVDALLAEKG